MDIKLSAIAAMDENGLLGAGNQLPWHLPADLQYFKRITLGKPVIMGRKTHQSIGFALPGRENIILTHDMNFSAKGCHVVHSIEDVFSSMQARVDELMLIGGASLYSQLLSKVQRLYLTKIHHQFSGDAYFPELDMTEWNEVSCETHQADDDNHYDYSFIVMERKQL